MTIALYVLSSFGIIITLFVICSSFYNTFQYTEHTKRIITGIFLSIGTLIFNLMPFSYNDIPIFDLKFMILILTAIFFDKTTLLSFGPIFIVGEYFSSFPVIYSIIVFIIAVMLKLINAKRILPSLLFIAIPPVVFAQIVVEKRIQIFNANIILTASVVISIFISIIIILSFLASKTNLLGIKAMFIYIDALLNKYKGIYTFKINRDLSQVKVSKAFLIDFEFDNQIIDYKEFSTYFKMAINEDFNILETSPENYFLITPKKGKEKKITYFASKKIFGGFRGFIYDYTNNTSKIDLTNYSVKRDYVTGLKTYAVMKEEILEKAKNSHGYVLFIRMQIDVNLDKESIYDIDFEIDCYKFLSELFKNNFPSADFYYIKNNEYQMVVHNIEKSINVISYVKNLKAILSEQYEIISKKITYNCFFGVYYCESLKLEKVTNITVALERVNFSKFQAIHSTTDNVSYFDKNEYDRHNRQLNRSRFIPTIIANMDFELNYQPIINTANGDIFAYEILIRINHINYQTTADFISDCFTFGYDIELDNQIMKQVLSTIKSKKIKQNLFLNMLSSSPISNDLISIHDELAQNGNKLFIEFTEMGNINHDDLLYKISKLKSHGIYVVIDDYGVGFQINSIISKINPDFLKIDNELIKNIDKDKRKECMVQSIINYAKAMGIKIIAEGIETKEEFDKTILLGFDYLQGYYVGKPSKDFEYCKLAIINSNPITPKQVSFEDTNLLINNINQQNNFDEYQGFSRFANKTNEPVQVQVPNEPIKREVNNNISQPYNFDEYHGLSGFESKTNEPVQVQVLNEPVQAQAPNEPIKREVKNNINQPNVYDEYQDLSRIINKMLEPVEKQVQVIEKPTKTKDDNEINKSVKNTNKVHEEKLDTSVDNLIKRFLDI